MSVRRRFASASIFTLLTVFVLMGMRAPLEEISNFESFASTVDTTFDAYEATIPGTLVTFDMIPVSGGTVKMSGEDGEEDVTVGPFWMSATEVTWDAYDIFAYQLDLSEAERTANADAESRPSRPYEAPDYGFGHQGFAAICITYHAAEQYTRWLSEKTGHSYRLATEAEWVYAAQAGATEASPSIDQLGELAWFHANADGQTQAVASKTANAWGLHDMLGNVSEWVTGVDGKPVAMGGSYKSKAEELAYTLRAKQTRKWNETDPQIPKSTWWLSDGPFVGFRIVREP